MHAYSKLLPFCFIPAQMLELYVQIHGDIAPIPLAAFWVGTFIGFVNFRGGPSLLFLVSFRE